MGERVNERLLRDLREAGWDAGLAYEGYDDPEFGTVETTYRVTRFEPPDPNPPSEPPDPATLPPAGDYSTGCVSLVLTEAQIVELRLLAG